jgi:hypothetical protein
LIEPEKDPEEVERGLTLDQAIEKYLVAVQATTGKNTYRPYCNEFEWSRRPSKKRYVSELSRSDAMALFAGKGTNGWTAGRLTRKRSTAG